MEENLNSNLTEYIQDSHNVYDLFIKIYFLVRRNQSTLIRKCDRNYKIYTEYLKLIHEILVKDSFKLDILSEENKSDLLEFLQNKQTDIYLILLAILVSIDVEFGIKNYVTSKDDLDLPESIKIISHLNSQQTIHLGKIYIRNDSFINKKYSGSEIIRQYTKIDDDINRFINYHLVYEEATSDYKFNLVKIQSPYIIDKFSKINEPRIAMVPFTRNKEYLNFVKIDNRVSLESLNDEVIYNEKIMNILNSLKFQNIDVIIFPEMVFSNKILINVKRYLKENKGCFALVICGSIWKDSQNKCVILGGDGIEIGSQIKLNPYHETIDFNNLGNNEDLDVTSENKYINIFDIGGFGRIATPICADFISEGYFSELIKLGVNLTFVPAYTASLKLFKTYASRLGNLNMGCSFISNCCIPMATRKKEKMKAFTCEISYCFIPLKDSCDNTTFMSCEFDKTICDKHSICYFLISFINNGCTFVCTKV